MAHHSKKETQSSSNGGGDNDPPHPKIDSSHKIPLNKKRKKIVGQEEEPEIKSGKMELDQPRDVFQHSRQMDIAYIEDFDEDESFVF